MCEIIVSQVRLRTVKESELIYRWLYSKLSARNFHFNFMHYMPALFTKNHSNMNLHRCPQRIVLLPAILTTQFIPICWLLRITYAISMLIRIALRSQTMMMWKLDVNIIFQYNQNLKRIHSSMWHLSLDVLFLVKLSLLVL